jgi:hypothetical protein
MTNTLRGQFDVKLGGDLELPCFLNLHAVNLVCEEHDLNLTGFQQALAEKPLKFLPLFIWAGVRTAAVLNDSELPITFEKFSVLFGSTDWSEITEKVGLAMALDAPKKATARGQQKS